MVRSNWIGPVFGVLALTGLAWGQTHSSPSAPAGEVKERFINVQEPGKPGQRCKILKMWYEANGLLAYQVQALDTGEMITIEDTDVSAPATGMQVRPSAMRIFHWGRGGPAPVGTPEPPSAALALGNPISVHMTTPEPSTVAVAPSTTPAPKGNAVPWPSAFTQTKPESPVVAAADQHLTPPAPPRLGPQVADAPAMPKKIELSPLASMPVPATPAHVEPVAAVPAHPMDVKPASKQIVVETTESQTAPIAASHSPYAEKAGDPATLPTLPAPRPIMPAVMNGSPYEVQPGNGSTVQAQVQKPLTPPTGSPYAPSASTGVPDPKQGPAVVLGTEKAPAPRVIVQGETPVPAGVVVKSEVCDCDNPPPGGRIAPLNNGLGLFKPPFGSQPVIKESKPVVVKTSEPVKVETSPAQPGDWRASWGKIDAPKAPMAAGPKLDLPHAEVKADDPLKSPEKYSKVPPGAGPDSPPVEKKTPLLAILAHDQPPAVVKADAKAPAAVPPLPGPTPDGGDKPAVPLGRGSVLAAASPELAPPAPPASTKAGSQAQSMGVNANEPNAFTDHPQGSPATVAGNAFSAPREPAPVKSEAEALAMNAFPPRTPASPAPAAVAMRTPTPAPKSTALSAPTGYVVPAGYKQQSGYDLAQLTPVLRESVYPSQREWAVESLATLDWRQQPQVLDLLVERAKTDPAPGVRAECVRSLGSMKANTPAVLEVIKALQSDGDDHVRQEAADAYANLVGGTSVSSPSH